MKNCQRAATKLTNYMKLMATNKIRLEKVPRDEFNLIKKNSIKKEILRSVTLNIMTESEMSHEKPTFLTSSMNKTISVNNASDAKKFNLPLIFTLSNTPYEDISAFWNFNYVGYLTLTQDSISDHTYSQGQTETTKYLHIYLTKKFILQNINLSGKILPGLIEDTTDIRELFVKQFEEEVDTRGNHNYVPVKRRRINSNDIVLKQSATVEFLCELCGVRVKSLTSHYRHKRYLCGKYI